jgi:hypothetical protein
MVCWRCDGVEMEEGVMLDYRHGAVRQAEWQPGPARMTWLGNVKVKKPVPVTTYRCPACGCLESYAHTPGADRTG